MYDRNILNKGDTLKHIELFVPGRTEIAGNHTDHQGGKVVCASIDAGTYMIIEKNDSREVFIDSEGFKPFSFDIDDVSHDTCETGTVKSLAYGIAHGFLNAGYKLGGCNMRIVSSVPLGSGLSSSASFEVALAAGFYSLFCDEDVIGQSVVTMREKNRNYAAFPSSTKEKRSPYEQTLLNLALISQYSESKWYGKECGCMDQIACAFGGMLALDLNDIHNPQLLPLHIDLEAHDYCMAIVDVKNDHSAKSSLYSTIPLDMYRVARHFGKSCLGELSEDEFYAHGAEVRESLGDLAYLRALHFFYENDLVEKRICALQEDRFTDFLAYTRLSAASSAQFLQNVSRSQSVDQPAMVALARAASLLGREGACRIHGGGFGGTIQAYVPLDRIDYFSEKMDDLLGEGACIRYEIAGRGLHFVNYY